jgi:Mannosyl-glycoprotein endo-beta-N-acetylglucosaminidase
MSIRLTDVAKYYKGLPNQVKALQALEKLLGNEGLSDSQEWVQLWRLSPPKPPVQAFTNTWDGIEAAAAAAGAKFPEVVAAQWALESAFGTALSGKNNYFGIKGPGTVKTTWEDYGKGPVTINASFQDFATPFDCVNHLVTQWYKDYKGYKGVNRATSREDCAYLLKREGYATDPIYAQKLIRLMEQHD